MKTMTWKSGATWCRDGLGIAMALAFTGVALGYDTVVLTADGDAFLRAGAANTNEGANPLLRLQAGGDNRALVWFDQQKINAQFNPGDTLISATLRVTVADNANNWGKNGDRTIDLHRMTMSWTEGNGINNEVPTRFRQRGSGPGVTWNMAVDAEVANGRMDLGVPWEMDKIGPFPWELTPTAQSIIYNSTVADTSFLWDVTNDLVGFLNGSNPNAGWIIKKTNESKAGKVLFCSREYDAFILANPDQATTSTPDYHGPQLILNIQRYVDPKVDWWFTSTADTYVRSGVSDTNEGGNPYMRLQASGDNRALVRFNLGQVDTSAVTRATLFLTIAEKAENWGNNSPRTVSAHRLLTNWAEGNGTNSEVPHWAQFRGSGMGATWNTPIDTNIANTALDLVVPGGFKWKGGAGFPTGAPNFFAPATGPGVDHHNDPVMGPGTVISFDVTQDVRDGAGFGWLIKKDDEGQSGKVTYYTREGAAAEGNLDLQPRLLLEF